MITTDINKAKEILLKNELIAIPTETVYGLAGNAYNETAIKKIFELKKRPFYNPLIIHLKSASCISDVALEIPESALILATTFWPGPLTLVLKKQPHISDLVTAGKETVAIRVPNHPVALALLDQLDFPLAAPSANPFGSISPTNAEHVYNYFGEELNVILDGGECEKGLESTIIGFENNQPVLYRHGSISLEEIENIVGKLGITTNSDTSPNAPGMLSRHYAPKTDTYLTNNISELLKCFEGKKIGLLLFKNTVQNKSIIHQEILSKSGNFNEAAKNLYAAMHRLDQNKLDVIIAERLPDEGLGKTINDKLERATKKE
ncbi:threonylcarbamoyl-AMP synthase [Flavobacterium franklandianum]|uniref:Threonylcarbamoyl-AMP synthase n=1 Tax=Flavobacterium bomense TaxID=2497483 RepID=A0A432CAB5_9FLAO|nr:MULTISPECIES: L-threonylcarbamoyladenylate synthase [Flavobacterium]RTY96887.1 threonylcarbamoyl-AMP synthase [Flavobacterium bomense]TRX28917.1 threonylcarbamoyl-AMP synthase [Flavobacterium franklandianum]